MMSDFFTPQSFGNVTEIFDAFCAENGVNVLSRCIVKHWVWEWSAGRRNDINHYATIIASETSLLPEFLFEFWAEADDDIRFTRKRIVRRKLTVNELNDPPFVSLIKTSLEQTWRSALNISANALTKAYQSELVRQGSLGSRMQSNQPATVPHILVVDDKSNIQRSVRSALQVRQLPVFIEQIQDVYDLGRAVELRPPDIVILDLKISTMSGIEVLNQALRKSSSVIVLTAQEVDDTAIDASQFKPQWVEMRSMSELLDLVVYLVSKYLR